MRGASRNIILESKHCLLLTIGLVGSLALIGCCTINRDADKWECVARKLDQVDRFSQEWGRASISDLAIVDNALVNSRKTDYFDLQYTNPTDFYMQQAQQNVQGTAALSVNEQFSGQISVQYSPSGGLSSLTANVASNAPSAGAGTNQTPAGASTSSASSSGTTNQTCAASSTNATSSATSTNQPSSGKSSGKGNPTNPSVPPMVPVAAVQPSEQPQLAQGVVLKIGATDKETERILNYMSNPVDLPFNKKAYLAVMQVSVLPGWRTRQGYVCEAQVNFSYAISKKTLQNHCRVHRCECMDRVYDSAEFIDSRSPYVEEFCLPQDHAPSVIAAFPFAEAQILDSASSYQRQLNFLAQLSGTIPNVPGLSAALQGAYNKLVQQGVATKNALPLVVPSSEGSDVTYRFDPELQALVEPSSASSGPGQILEPSSFPALIVLICDADDLATWDAIRADVTTRWVPITHRNPMKSFFVDWWLHGSAIEKPFCDAGQVNAAAAFDIIGDALKREHSSSGTTYAYQEIERRFENLKTTAMGHTVRSRLPLVRPFVTDVSPSRFRQDFVPETFTIHGFYFQPAGAKESDISLVLQGPGGEFQFQQALAGCPGLKARTASAGTFTLLDEGHTVTVTPAQNLTKRLLPGHYDLDLITAAGKTHWTNAVEVMPVPSPVISTLVSGPLKEYGTNGVSLPSTQRMTIYGGNFVVGDCSLRVSIGGRTLREDDWQVENNETIDLWIRSGKLALAPGRYPVIVASSGGTGVSTDTVQVVYEAIPPADKFAPPRVAPRLAAVSPSSFRLDQLQTKLNIFGDFFAASDIKYVGMGGIALNHGLTNEHLIVADISNFCFAATNYDLEVANEVGRAVLTNAVVVLPVPAPILTGVFPAQVNISTDELRSVRIAIMGKGLLVKDDSLVVAIGSTVFTNTVSTDPNHGAGPVTTVNDNLLFVDIATNILTKVGTGNHGVTVVTSGGQHILSNALTIAKSKAPIPGAPVITGVDPKHGSLYAPTVLSVVGSNFDGTAWWKDVKYVTVGGRLCEFKPVSDGILAVTVPAWSRLGSTNDLSMATNKLDVVVISPRGVAVSTNAVAFDLMLPRESNYSTPLTPQEEKIRKMLDAVFYAARVTGSNPVLQTSVKVSASAGDPEKSTDKNSTTIPGITACITVNSNATPATAAPAKSTTPPTNSPSQSP